MNIEQQRQWAYIALRATATPPPPTAEQMARRFKDKVIMPYQFNSHGKIKIEAEGFKVY